MVKHSGMLIVLSALLLSLVTISPPAVGQSLSIEEELNPLPHYPQGKVRIWDPASAFKRPYAIDLTGIRHKPGSGVITPPPEYHWSAGILLRWGAWNDVLIDFILEAADGANDSMVYLLVQNDSQKTSASNTLSANGVDMNQVEFLTCKSDSIWIRDYGPHLIWHDGTRGVVDSHYYPQRPFDNAAPVYIAKRFKMPLYDIPMMYSGGNFLCTSNNYGYVSSIIYGDNPGLGGAKIAELYKTYQGVERLHIFSAFPYTIDGTGHIDMWMCIVGDDKVIIGEYPQITPTYPAYVITENAVAYMQNLGFTVYRVPNHNSGSGGYNGIHFTYTNGIPLNNKVIVPIYGGSHAADDAAALAAYQAALPGKTVVGINCTTIIPAAGALHCICMHVPAYLDAVPAAKVLDPDGGEVCAGDYPVEITWAAEDDEEVTAVDILYSLDGGVSFPFAVATGEIHDGLYEGWNPPWLASLECRIKVVAHDGMGNSAEDESDQLYETDFLKVTEYDFATGAGVDRWAFGTYTDSWSQDLEKNRNPSECSTPVDQVDPQAYGKLAVSDATGGDTDTNRYINPAAGAGRESTLIAVFQIKERPGEIRSLEFLWEGYGGNTQHMEMYVWDYTMGNWSNGQGLYSNNNFMDNGSHRRDRTLKGAVTEKVHRYLSPTGEVTVLIYNDTAQNQTFHDYLCLKVLSEPFAAHGKKL